MIGWLFTLVAFPLVGAAVRRVAGPVQYYLAGAGITGAFVFVASVAGAPIWLAALLLAFATVAVLVVTPRPRTEGPRFYAPDALLALFALWLLTVTTIVPLDDYDGRAFWLLKAKAIAHEQRVDGPFFQQKTSPSPRNQYPLLVPIDAALTMMAGRSLDEWNARVLYACFGIAFALEIRRRIALQFSPRLGAWCGAALLSLPVVLSRSSGAASAGSDVALGAFAAAAFFDIAAKGSPARTGMWLSFVALTKSEGLPLAFLLLVVAGFIYRKRIVLAAVPLAVSTTALLVWRTRIQRSDENPFAAMVFRLPDHLDRFRNFLVGFAEQPLELRTWGVIWIAFIIAAVALVLRKQLRPLALSTAVIAPMIVLYAAVVAVTDWPPDIIVGLAPRLLTQLLGPAFYVIAAALSLRDVEPGVPDPTRFIDSGDFGGQPEPFEHDRQGDAPHGPR